MTAPRRGAVVAGVVLVVLAAAFVEWQADDDGRSAATSAGTASSASAVVSRVTAASAPFTSLTAGTARVGDRTISVVVADSLDERVQGLRGRSDAAPYDGMLFVFDADSSAAFTMAGVRDPLEIAFFDAAGRRVDERRMEPCVGTDATCPLYRPSAPYRYTLETAPGEMPTGDLRVRAP
jgi:uncharacterized membrane protein (UPF0127 family)